MNSIRQRLASGVVLVVFAITAQAQDDGKEDDWDVNTPPETPSVIPMDTREGTWMTVDVSPDGTQIVFDLLGDLYLLPVEGGEARRITEGLAWDIHPRFSPDGKYIAFISDRSGGDNLWLVDSDGANPRAVSDENFRLVSNPSWAPDGDYIAVRKHFTSARSLGAGEIWIYHRAGGDGLQMVERLNDQKDINDPSFSSDGRYLYYTYDATPGAIFEYNKDSNGEIYRVNRLDRQTGVVEPYITGPGGAVRPVPSPDGRTVAFVRRRDFKTVLVLKDTASGVESIVYDDLDRDNQEIWATHGVYPNFAWTPDSAELVFWAGGGIKKLDVESREVTAIPFHVNATQTVLPVVRFPVTVAPETFEVKMLRWPTVTPSGDRVVFQALGHLYVRELPNGEPRRLTTQKDHFEFYPSISRDGKWVVYVSWDDEELGAVRKVSLRGGRGRVLTPDPGHYVEPVFSPDGQTVVYRKLGGHALRSRLWDRDPGVYEISAEGGEPDRITAAGTRPRFAADSDRLYVQRVEDDHRNLVEIDLNTGEEVVLFASEYATEMELSPDGRWVAFQERFNSYLAPFTRTGQTVVLDSGDESVPLTRVSRDSGNYLHWSGDSKRLYWSLGPELFTQRIEDAFDFIEGAPNELPGPPASGTNIGFEASLDVPDGLVALTGGRILTMHDGNVIENGTVVVAGNRILSLGDSGSTEIPEDAFVVDVSGKTVMPGFIDVHWHGAQSANEITPEQNWENYATLAFGVTTIHDPSNDNSSMFAAKELARTGGITAPRLFSTGRILYGATTSFTAKVDSLEDARSHLRRMKAIGAESVKSYNQPRRDQRQQILTAARELGINVVPEGGALFHANMSMIADGHTGIEHSLVVADVYDDVVSFWSQRAVGYTPTLVVAFGGISGEYYWYQHTEVFNHPRLRRFVPREVLVPRSRRRQMAPEADYNHIYTARHATQLQRAGVSVQIGAHGQREGLGTHWEMWMLAQGGMTPANVLRAATIDGARYLGFDTDIGSLAEGKLADIIVLDGDPLADIRNTDTVSLIMVNGRLYDANTMNEIGNRPRERNRFYWE